MRIDDVDDDGHATRSHDATQELDVVLDHVCRNQQTVERRKIETRPDFTDRTDQDIALSVVRLSGANEQTDFEFMTEKRFQMSSVAFSFDENEPRSIFWKRAYYVDEHSIAFVIVALLFKDIIPIQFTVHVSIFNRQISVDLVHIVNLEQWFVNVVCAEKKFKEHMQFVWSVRRSRQSQ